jgi:DNA modification methylase
MQVAKVKINSIKTNPKNPRLIKDDKFKKLVNSIKEFPQMLELRPIVVDENNIILGGNMRHKACIEAGLKEVYIVQAKDLTELQKDEFIVKDNVGFGEWDWDILANEWDIEKLTDWGLELPLDLSVQELEAEEDDYEIPNEITTDIVLGDLFEIGEHRLLCGDSTDSDQVAKLMNGQKADMVFTDPPYGIKVVKSEMVGANFGIAKKGKYSEVIADDTTETAKEFYDTCISLGMNKFIIWGGNYFTSFLPFSDGWLIWNKRAGTDIRNTFADGEMAWCSFHTPIRIYDQLWNGMIREGEKDKRVHPTQKPIRMLSEIITEHIKGNLIFDGFLGSGSILVASHQLKRKCYGMELDPKYCQVIIERMKKLDPSLEIKRNGEILN